MKNKVVKVHPNRVQEYIDEYNKEGWSLVSNQRIQELERHDDGLYTVTFNELTFSGPDDAHDAESTIEARYYDRYQREKESRKMDFKYSKKFIFIGLGVVALGIILLIISYIIYNNGENGAYAPIGAIGLIGCIIGASMIIVPIIKYINYTKM